MGFGNSRATVTLSDSFERRASAGWLLRRVLMGGLLSPFLVDGGLILIGQPGLFGVGSGVAVRELTIIAALLGFLLINTRTLRRIDRERRKAMHSLQAAHESLQVWVDEQARIEEELRDSERRYRFLIDAVPQMVWTARSDGGVDFINRRWSEFTGQTLEEATDWGWTPVIHPDDLDRCTDRWRRAFESGETYVIEHRFRRADGTYRWQLGRAEPMRDEQGRVIRWFGTCTDIDDQKRVEAELRLIQEGLAERVSERTAELEQANQTLVAEVLERKLAEEVAQSASRAKGEFLANMSHEIRTPMNGILGMIELALNTSLTPTQREYLEVISTSADALLTVINDILDFSKIEAGKLELDPVSFSLRDAVSDTLRSLALRAHDKGLELACRIDPEVPRTVVGDAGRLRQVLVNLIGNAIKFTERGEVVVTVAVAYSCGVLHVEPNLTTLRFAVSDTGIGIPVHKRDAIFAAFEQADGSTTRKYGGTGLGLAISSKLVSLMGGTISVSDGPAGGSLFQFIVQFAADLERLTELRNVKAESLEGLRILMVDDNVTNLRISEEILNQWGCSHDAVTEGRDVLGELAAARQRGNPYRVVLLDHWMPTMSGMELAQRIREWEAVSSPEQPRVKLLMLTSGGVAASEPRDSGQLDGWLQKPVRPSELLNLLLEALEASEGPALSLQSISPLAMIGSVETTIIPLEILLAEDHPINQKVATRMIEGLGHRVSVVGDGRAAVAASGSKRFDLLLMDVQMPEMDGFEALAAIRSRERIASYPHSICSPLPIIALTAHAMTGDRERCLNAGFDDYLSKPVHAARLREVLNRFRPPPSRPSEPLVEANEPAHFDRQAAVTAMGGMDSLLKEVIHLFLDDGPRLLEQIHQAIHRVDHTSLSRLSHTMAGSASNFGPNIVVQAARAVEVAAQSQAAVVDLTTAADRLDHAFNQFQAVLLAEAVICP